MKFKIKANKIDENLHKALLYVAEESSKDNNAEQGLEEKALYNAAYYFKVDYDLLCNEWEENSEKYFEEFLDSI